MPLAYDAESVGGLHLEENPIVLDHARGVEGLHEKIVPIIRLHALRYPATMKNQALDMMDTQVGDYMFARPAFPIPMPSWPMPRKINRA